MSCTKRGPNPGATKMEYVPQPTQFYGIYNYPLPRVSSSRCFMLRLFIIYLVFNTLYTININTINNTLVVSYWKDINTILLYYFCSCVLLLRLLLPIIFRLYTIVKLWCKIRSIPFFLGSSKTYDLYNTSATIIRGLVQHHPCLYAASWSL